MRADTYNMSRKEWEVLIEQYIFSEFDREMLKRRLLDGITFEALAEEFNLSVTQTKNRIYKAEKKLLKHI